MGGSTCTRIGDTEGPAGCHPLLPAANLGPLKAACEQIKGASDSQSGSSSSLEERFFTEKKIWRQAGDCVDDKGLQMREKA